MRAGPGLVRAPVYVQQAGITSSDIDYSEQAGTKGRRGSAFEANRTKGAKVSAHAAQDEDIGEGMSLLQHVDVNVRNKFSSDGAVLAEWASASHVARHSSSGKQSDNPPTPTPQALPPSGQLSNTRAATRAALAKAMT